MSRYLIDKFKGKYRVLAPIDSNGDFPKELNGSYSDNDLYIKCKNKITIYHIGGKELECNIPSIGRGRGLVRTINADLPDTIYNVVETDEEVLFNFKSEHMDSLAKYLKPQTLGADISPWSSRNRPKRSYTIPNEDLKQYDNVTASVPPTERLAISHMTQAFFHTKYKSKKAYEAHKQKIKTSGLKAKEYIHSIGLWGDYIKYLNKEIKND